MVQLWAHVFGVKVKMGTPHTEYLGLGPRKAPRLAAYRKLFDREIDTKLIEEIRLAANTGLALGNDIFRHQVEHLTGQRQHHLERGPKAKHTPDQSQ